MRFRPSVPLVIAAAAILSSCTSYPRSQSFDGWKLSDRTTSTGTDKGNYRTGHLLVTGDGLVLLLERRFDPELSVVCDEECDRIMVQLPRPLRVGEIKNPIAYYQTCSCVWGLCHEEALARGRVVVERVGGGSVRADLDLSFPSLHLQKRSDFASGDPREWELEPKDPKEPQVAHP